MPRGVPVYGLIIQGHAEGPIVQYLDHTFRLARSPNGWGLFAQKAGEKELCYADLDGGYETARTLDTRALGTLSIQVSDAAVLRVDLNTRTVEFRTGAYALSWTCAEPPVGGP